MAFDGITVRALCKELSGIVSDNGRITKIAQPENDELNITIKNREGTYKLMLSADASLPLAYLTSVNKVSPLVAPNFCMLLRKHIGSAKILEIRQPKLERVIDLYLEHYNEMGDLCRKHLVLELMGKHSNIIFTDDSDKIIDSIKHVNGLVSSVREVLPGRDYFIPDTMGKHDPLLLDFTQFKEAMNTKNVSLAKAIYTSYTGISPIIAQEICFNAMIDSDIPSNALNESEYLSLFKEFEKIMDTVIAGDFKPNIIYDNDIPVDFSPIVLNIYKDKDVRFHDSISFCLEHYYGEKNAYVRMRERSGDLRRIVTSLLEKDYKKLDIQEKQLLDTKKKDKFKMYGTMITSYTYMLTGGESKLTAPDFETGEEVTIPLDKDLSAIENANRYFDKYNKLKRTATALDEILSDTKNEIEHLESIATALDIAASEDDLKEIKKEMTDWGYIHLKSSDKKSKFKSEPLHFISSDGFHIYVGKNNYQNEYITFKLANGDDWWFHSKKYPGSHVIVKSEGKELTDKTFEEAAALAAYYSKGRDQQKVEIDYCLKKIVKKVSGAKPGFVIYHSNYSMSITPKNNLKEA